MGKNSRGKEWGKDTNGSKSMGEKEGERGFCGVHGARMKKAAPTRKHPWAPITVKGGKKGGGGQGKAGRSVVTDYHLGLSRQQSPSWKPLERKLRFPTGLVEEGLEMV